MQRLAGRMCLWALFIMGCVYMWARLDAELHTGKRRHELVAISHDLIIPMVVALIASVFATYLWDKDDDE
jgi:hypothetical protein